MDEERCKVANADGNEDGKFEMGKESIRMICLGKGAEKDRKERRMNIYKKILRRKKLLNTAP